MSSDVTVTFSGIGTLSLIHTSKQRFTKIHHWKIHTATIFIFIITRFHILYDIKFHIKRYK